MTTRGKRIAGEQEWGRRDHDGHVRSRASFRTERVYKRVWLWSPESYARGLLWRDETRPAARAARNRQEELFLKYFGDNND